VWWKRHVGLSPQGEFSTAPATPALPGDGIPLGENYRLPFGNHRDTNPGQTKNIQKNQKKMKISKIQENIGSSHSWSSPLALDECVKQPKKTDKSPQVYDKSTYYINLAA